MRDKPTLDELFESKKLDLPDVDFWNGFQNRVKGQAIAALSQRSRTSKLRRVALFGFVPVFALVMISWGILQTHITSCLLYTSPSPRDISGSRMPSSA